MGDACSPENLVDAVLPAVEELNGRVSGDLFNENRLQKTWENNPRVWLEYYNTKAAIETQNFGKRYNPVQLLDVARPEGVKTEMQERIEAIKRFGGGNYILAPTERFNKGFTAPLAKKLRAFDAKYQYGSKEYAEAWKNEITPAVEKIQSGILNASNNLKKDTAYHKFIKDTYDLEPAQARDAMRYLTWLGQGGPTAAKRYGLAEDMKDYNKATRAFVQNIATWNLPWTIYNVGDMGRVTSGFLTDKRFTIDKFPKIVTAMAKAFNFKEGLPPELERITGGDEFRKGTKGGAGIFEMSNIMQRKYAYALDKELGGGGMGLMSSHVFDYEPWNAPEIYWDKDDAGNQLMRLGRFMMAESTRNYNLVKEMVKGSDRGRARAAAELASDYMIKAMMFGTTAAMPLETEWLMQAAMGKDNYEQFKEGLSKLNPAGEKGSIGGSIQGLADAAFGNGKVDANIGKSMQPSFLVLPRFGMGAQQITAGIGKTGSSALEAIENLRKGDTGKAAMQGLASAMTVVNFMYPGQTVLGSIGTSVQSTKIVEAIADTIGAKNPKTFATEMTKAVIGSRNAKQDKGEKPMALSEYRKKRQAS